MTQNLATYIALHGTTGEAMEHWHGVFGGELQILRYGDMQLEGMPFTPPPSFMNHVLTPERRFATASLSLADINEILRIPLIGVIPESEVVLQASNQGVPVIHMNGSDASEAYKDVVARFLGEDKPMRFIDVVKPSFFKRLFGAR